MRARPCAFSATHSVNLLGGFLKSLTRRELLFEVFSKDTLKSLFGAYNEFTKAQDEAKRVVPGQDAARRIGEQMRELSDKFLLNQNVRKEG